VFGESDFAEGTFAKLSLDFVVFNEIGLYYYHLSRSVAFDSLAGQQTFLARALVGVVVRVANLKNLGDLFVSMVADIAAVIG